MTTQYGEYIDVDASEAVEILTSEYNEFDGYEALDNEVSAIEAEVQEQLMGYIRRGR